VISLDDGPSAARRRRATALPAPRPEWAYFFDIDGTLVDLADSPRAVRLDAVLRQLVERLYHATGGAVALISGRAIADVDVLFPGTRFPAAGQHGTERRDAAGHVSYHASPSPALERVRHGLARAVARHAGLVLEDKGLSLALHYRRAPRLAGYAHRLVRSFLGAGERTYAIQKGKRIVELKPAGRDKGVAVVEFMVEEPFRGRTPVFVGDDITDEYGFATVNRLRGHSVKVGAGRTAARWRLRDVRAVRQWLERGLRAP
jgi:trehalose 6-phosphate phosphatase